MAVLHKIDKLGVSLDETVPNIHTYTALQFYTFHFSYETLSQVSDC